MPIETITVIDGAKLGRFDELVLEIGGLSGQTGTKRLNALLIEDIAVQASGDEWLLAIKTRNGGMGMAISAEKREAWERLAQAVKQAKAAIDKMGLAG